MTKKHLPVLGVGPLCVIPMVILTIAGIILTKSNMQIAALRYLSMGLGIIIAILGFVVWIYAIKGKKNIVKYIENNQLCTTGIYAYCRNPIYSGIGLMCTGAILISANLWLYLLPPAFWLYMTFLLKGTEEKWLTELYGDEYLAYCRQVNRCIPMPPSRQKL